MLFTEKVLSSSISRFLSCIGYAREECMFQGLQKANPEDIIMHGDVDQIVRPALVYHIPQH